MLLDIASSSLYLEIEKQRLILGMLSSEMRKKILIILQHSGQDIQK